MDSFDTSPPFNNVLHAQYRKNNILPEGGLNHQKKEENSISEWARANGPRSGDFRANKRLGTARGLVWLLKKQKRRKQYSTHSGKSASVPAQRASMKENTPEDLHFSKDKGNVFRYPKSQCLRTSF
ncbi:hypothetical protein JTE90_004660 [Oedothorax gibbosus]|uniref:Uncharacterized protein n=1 Tax=Oedothorax gibbosus TaxID=931172 RepID=A0AAV6UWJ5_9ARAC|nr:hypothetical protein JTE90_004660 [Oedothorax gibbosus]